MTAAPLTVYYREAASWDADRIARATRDARRAWQVAAAGWICAVAGAVSLVLLMPLKRVEPFVVRVDNSTGIVDVVPVYDGKAAVSQTVSRYFLTHYVTICERFNFATAESDYEECGAFHGAARNQAWYALWNPNNPASPLDVHKDGSSVRAQVTSVSFFKRASGVADLAQVRYVKARRAAGGGVAEDTTHWIATLEYAYADPSTDPRVRRWNPLGFKVVDFRPEPEILPEAPAGEGGSGAAQTAAAVSGGSP